MAIRRSRFNRNRNTINRRARRYNNGGRTRRYTNGGSTLLGPSTMRATSGNAAASKRAASNRKRAMESAAHGGGNALNPYGINPAGSGYSKSTPGGGGSRDPSWPCNTDADCPDPFQCCGQFCCMYYGDPRRGRVRWLMRPPNPGPSPWPSH